MSEIRERLIAIADGDRKFSAKLIPNIDGDLILGVRVPALRALAKEIAEGDWRGYLSSAQDYYMEEVMLQGLVIGCAKTDTEERLALVTGFVPRIDNWAVCDSVCAGLKFGKKDAERVWDFLKVYFDSDKEYGIRFAVVMFLFHYIDGAYAARGLESLAPIRHEGYYVKMAVAWAVSVCYVKFPSVALPYLQNNAFDIVTHNKALQKILESRRMSRDDEVLIRSLKRKPPPKQSGGGGG